jgi:Glycosyl transferase family 2
MTEAVPHRPRVSVIIATYNWSAALRCALRSVLLQSFRDFEVLVIGDGCTDDSEAIVRSFGDPRLRWENLPQNSGSQSAPNNRGFALAAGEFIAYLGHDDIWYPTHLQSLVTLMDARAADLAIGTALIYGPSASGVRLVSGLFDPSGFTLRDFAPPSSFMIRRTILARIGAWQDPKTLSAPIDYDLLRRAQQSGAVFAGTGELTVFKFNAAFRRDAYRHKEVGDQQAMLARIEAGIDFRQEEWAELVRAFLTGRAWPMLVSGDIDSHPLGALHAQNRIFKGLRPYGAAPRHERLHQPTRWPVTTIETLGFEWHELEERPPFGSFRWTGPSTISTLRLPVSAGQDLNIEIHILDIISREVLAGLRLTLNGTPVGGSIDPTDQGTYLLRTQYSAAAAKAVDGDGIQVSIQLPRTQSFLQQGRSPDARPLGIAVNWIQAGPI